MRALGCAQAQCAERAMARCVEALVVVEGVGGATAVIGRLALRRDVALVGQSME